MSRSKYDLFWRKYFDRNKVFYTLSSLRKTGCTKTFDVSSLIKEGNRMRRSWITTVTLDRNGRISGNAAHLNSLANLLKNYLQSNEVLRLRTKFIGHKLILEISLILASKVKAFKESKFTNPKISFSSRNFGRHISEIEFSNALYSSSNQKILKQLLETKLKMNLDFFTVICREFPVAKEEEFEKVTGKTAGFVDLLAMGICENKILLFIIEIKKNCTKSAIDQVMKYTRSFWHFLKGSFGLLSLWAKVILDLFLVNIKKDELKIELIPALIFFDTRSNRYKGTLTAKKLLLISLDPLGKTIRTVFKNYQNDRLISITNKFPALKQYYKKILNSSYTFSETVVPYYPTKVKDILELKSIRVFSSNRRASIVRVPYSSIFERTLHYPEQLESPNALDIFFEFLKFKFGEFILQVFANGINKGRPVLYLQINNNEYLALQMSENKVTNWRINGIFNKFVAYDCTPLSKPIFPGSFCFLKGEYEISKVKKTNILRLKLYDNKMLSRKNNKFFLKSTDIIATTYIISPLLNHIFTRDALRKYNISLNDLKKYNILPYMNPSVINIGIQKLQEENNQIKNAFFRNELILTNFKFTSRN